MNRLLPYQPDAIFFHSDPMALGGLHALADAGLSVPGDVAVIGFDDLPTSARYNSPLTTVSQPTQRIGMVAAEMLIDIIYHPDTQPRRILLPTELVIRQSTRLALP